MDREQAKIRLMEEAEEQYKLTLASDPKDVSTHSNYGILLDELDRNKEAEEQFKLAIKIDSKYPNIHGAYGLLLLKMNSEKKAIKETKIASRLCGENRDKIKEHLALAWLYERLAGKYYKLKDYQKSGDYAKESGNEYIEAGKHVEERYKSTYLSKGYTLLGRAKIRKLEIKLSFYGRIIHRVTQNRVSYEVKTLTKIMDCVVDASKCYKKAAEASPENNQICNACSTSMLCLSNMLDYMLAVITKKKEITKLEDEIEKWENRLIVCRNVYKGNAKGEAFIQSLDKLMDCIKNLEKYKNSRMRMDERAFEDCVKELLEVAANIEGPLQKIIEDSANKMDICRLKYIPYTEKYIETLHENTLQQNKLTKFLNWILTHPIRTLINIFVALIIGVAANIVYQKFFL
jgi:tetratricopeptide (TPR) repeat protein